PGSGNGCVSSDHRPLSAALAKADQALPQSNNPRFIVLVTDGAPQGNCALPDDCIGAQNELTTLQNHGIRPVVILRLGDGTGDCLLNLVSGTGSQQYYTASSYGDLVAALGTILSATVCHVTLTPAPPVQDASRFQVSINTHLYSNDEKTGWT